MEEISRRVQQEQQPEYLYVLINNLIEILLHLDKNVDAYENMISYFKRVIQSLLEQKEVGKAVGILKNLNDTTELGGLTDNQIFALHRIFEIASEASSIELLGKGLEGNGEADPESIRQYLQFLTKQAVDPLCFLLGELESEKWRKVICDCLADLCKEEINPLGKFLSDSNPFLVSQILRILEKVGHPSTLKYLGNLIDHNDSKVREEVLKLIAQFGEEGTDFVRKFLTDSLPEIRGKASRILARMNKDGAVKSLMEIIFSEDFYRRNYEEKASFLMALAETRSEEAIPILKKIAKKRKWFKKGKWDEMRLCAANVLKVMEGGPRQGAQR